MAMENGSQVSVTTLVHGRTALYRPASLGGLAFPVKILDARKVWGRVDVLINPIGGSGEKWVEASSLRVIEA